MAGIVDPGPIHEDRRALLEDEVATLREELDYKDDPEARKKLLREINRKQFDLKWNPSGPEMW